MPAVSIVIAAWNSAPVLAACLDSIARDGSSIDSETIVVDDASTDQTRELLSARADVIAVHNEESRGYCAAINRGAALATADVLLLCNSDVEFRPGAIAALVGALDSPGTGVSGPFYERPDGRHQPGCARFPSVLGSLVTGFGLHRLLPDPLRARLAPMHWSHDVSRDVDVVMGAVQAVRADVFRDLEGYWPLMYASETDLAFRAMERGQRCRFVAEARVMHVGDFSNSQVWSRPERAARVAGAERAFLAPHVGSVRAALIRAVTVLTSALRIPLLSVIGRRERAAEYAATLRVYLGASPQA